MTIHDPPCVAWGPGFFVFETDSRAETQRPSRVAQINKCKAICFGCPFKLECLENELNQMRQGVRSVGMFGGTTTKERRQMLGTAKVRMVRTPITHGTNNGYRAHLRDRTPPCNSCRHAHALSMRDSRPSRVREQV